MPDQLNRSPCASLLRGRLSLQEGVAPAPLQNTDLRETRSAERSHVTLREETRAGKTVTLVDVTVATAGRLNRNQRLYTREVWQKAVDAAQEEIEAGKFWALMEHPEDGWDSWDPLKGRLSNICLRYESLTLDGEQVKATGILIDTAAGQDLKALLAGGIVVGVSSNGTGSAKYLPAKEVLPDHPDPEAYIAVIQDDFRLLTVDMVSDPSDVSGSARQREQRRHRPPTPGPQEGSMNPKIKALMEKHGVTTVEALKAKAPAEYTTVLEELMQESLNPPAPRPNPTPAPESGTMSLADYRALESTVVELRGTVNTLTADNLNARRDAIAITALEAARLPSAGKVKHGETEIDLDASFRTELIQTARTAENDDTAKTAVDEKIATRRGVLGQRESAPVQRPQNGLKLPAGDNSRTQTEAERIQTGQTRQFESVRRGAGLI
ncbi:hypothetical protein [Deinococcus sp. QL22]|uniref:hypothetical protein n=1 Tax=Deinococcus sp. QL22 TaxID=2939437 RepID=UPI002017668A|nr:hypothetical protein [Deinococcus sp. QL22]UQN06298.1 hypothetical protein M1R55_15785 [Deinococcus sp. QL22]